MINIQLNEMIGVVGCIDPDVHTAAAYITDEIDMNLWSRVLFIVMAGTLGSSATLDFIVKGGAATNAGSHATAVTGKAITQVTQAGTDGSDKQYLVEVSAEECAAQGLNFIEGTMTVATATSDAGVIVIGLREDYSDVTAKDLASVTEIIT
jgi:hypothetical protein